MLHETTIHVTRTNKEVDELARLGIEPEESEENHYYRFMFDVSDITYHHEYEYEIGEETKFGTVIFFDDGMQISSLEDYNTISELRMKNEATK